MPLAYVVSPFCLNAQIKFFGNCMVQISFHFSKYPSLKCLQRFSDALVDALSNSILLANVQELHRFVGSDSGK